MAGRFCHGYRAGRVRKAAYFLMRLRVSQDGSAEGNEQCPTDRKKQEIRP